MGIEDDVVRDGAATVGSRQRLKAASFHERPRLTASTKGAHPSAWTPARRGSFRSPRAPGARKPRHQRAEVSSSAHGNDEPIGDVFGKLVGDGLRALEREWIVGAVVATTCQSNLRAASSIRSEYRGRRGFVDAEELGAVHQDLRQLLLRDRARHETFASSPAFAASSRRGRHVAPDWTATVVFSSSPGRSRPQASCP
jgi:hypothetical protein